MIHIFSKELTELLQATSKPVAALFYAKWCSYCLSFKNEFEETTKKASDIEFLEVDISDEDDAAWNYYSIDIVPTLILFGRDKPLARTDGVPGKGLNKKDLTRIIDIARQTHA